MRTPLGDFSVELFSDRFGLFIMKHHKHPPDQEMLRRAAELTHFAETQGEQLLDIVFGAYRLFLDDQGVESLDLEGIPKKITRENVGQLIEQPSLHVSHSRPSLLTRLLGVKESYRSSIVTNPVWDPEHGFAMDFEDGRIVSAGGAPFKLEDGVLRFL